MKEDNVNNIYKKKEDFMAIKRRIRHVIVFLLMIISFNSFFIISNAAAKDTAAGDCVSYAKARFREYWGFDLHRTGTYGGYEGAQAYYYNAASWGDQVSSMPAAGALAIWGDSTYGHVGFVEQVSGNSVFISEGGFNGGYREQWRDLSSMNNPNQTFLGFVYVAGCSISQTSNPPTNPQISMSQYWYDLGDTIEIYISAQGAVQYDMAMFKDGSRIEGAQIFGLTGTFSMMANKHGIGEYSVYFSCTNSAGTVDSSWLNFSVVGAAEYSEITTAKTEYSLNDIVSISVSTVCAKGQVIGIDKTGVGRVITQESGPTYTINASQLGVGKYSAYFTVYNGSGGVDTERVYFSIVEETSESTNQNEQKYTGWRQDANFQWYYYTNGVMQTGWLLSGGTWYYLNSDGTMQTGWATIGNELYFFNDSGAMFTGWGQTSDGTWYYFKSSGAAARGWEYIGGVWYAFDENCEMITGWAYDGDLLYYMEESGAMVSNMWLYTVDNEWYYMTSSGAAARGWAFIDGTWYYFDSEYEMVTGWQVIGGKWYYFHGSGAMAANQWVGNYYLQSDGSMATNKWIGRYYVGADGCWIP